MTAGGGPRSAGPALAAYAGLTALVLWPLVRAPHRLVIPNEDTFGNAWVLAFVARQAASDPARLFDANQYFPYPAALAFTESLIPQALLAAPVLAAGGSPLLAHNLVLLLSFPACGLGAYWLARELGAGAPGAFLAGLAWAFGAYRFEHLVHVQSLWLAALPFGLGFLRRAVRGGGWRDASLAATFLLAQALMSGYYAPLTAAAAGAALLLQVRTRADLARSRRLAAALAVAGVLAAAAFLPYRAVAAEQEALRGAPQARSLDELRHWSAQPASYLDPGRRAALPHLRALHEAHGGGEPLFASFAILGLALLAPAVAARDEGLRLAVALTVLGFLLSLGPEIGVGPWRIPGPFEALRRLPGMSLLRTPGRFGVLALLGLSLLAALAWTRLTRRLSRRTALLATLFLCAWHLAEAWPAGAAGLFHPDEPPPPTVAWLARAPAGPVLELPWDHETRNLGARYLYWSTGHWQRLVNGWGAFEPVGPFERGVVGKLFPSPYSARVLRRAGIRYVVVHLDRIPEDRPGRRARASSRRPLPEGVALVAEMGPHRIYELAPLGRSLELREKAP